MTGNVRIDAAMRCTLSMAHMEAGELESAERELEEAIRLSRSSTMRPVPLAFLSLLRIKQVRLDEACALAREAVELERSASGFEPFRGLPALALCRALLAQGRPDDARVVLVEALAEVTRLMSSVPTLEHRTRFLEQRLPTGELLELADELGVPRPDPARA